ncbi:MAG: hypothetical protein QOF44_4310 [Streptomyces sp.]|nr:hypothetical protein [Streptomyces sp.]
MSSSGPASLAARRAAAWARTAAASSSWARAVSSRAVAVATEGQTRSMAALQAAPTSTAKADTPIQSSTATGAASLP